MEFDNQYHYVVIQDSDFGFFLRNNAAAFSKAVRVGENTVVNICFSANGKNQLGDLVENGLAVIHDKSNRDGDEPCWIAHVFNTDADAQSNMETIGRIFQVEDMAKGLKEVGQDSVGMNEQMGNLIATLFMEWVLHA